MNQPKSQRATLPRGSADGKLTDPSNDEPTSKSALLSEHIGRELRTMFEEVVAEPVPEKFRKLLEELEKKSATD